MINSLKGTITRARHFGAQGNEEFELNVTVTVDSKAWNKIKKKSDPVRAIIVDVKNYVYDQSGIHGVPHVSTEGRAKAGLKTVKFTFFMDKATAKSLGADVNEWCLYHQLFDSEKNIIRVDFQKRTKVS